MFIIIHPAPYCQSHCPPPPVPIQCRKHLNACKPINLVHLLMHLPTRVTNINNFQHLAIHIIIDWRLLYPVAWEKSHATTISTTPHPLHKKTFSLLIFPFAESKSFTMIRSYRRWKSVSSLRALSQNIHRQRFLVHLTVAPMIARANPNNI